MKIIIQTTFTESPSTNIRVMFEGTTIFYNSDRLQGSDRIPLLGKIIGIKSLHGGTSEFEITKEQFNRICDL